MRWRKRRHSAKYRAALHSSHWRRLRAAAYRRAHGRCEAFWCRSRGPLELHHLHYRTLGRETSRDVKLLCKRHHAKADKKRRARWW